MKRVNAPALARWTRRAAAGEEPDPDHKYARVAIREAFDVARSSMQDYARRQRGATKVHERTSRGRVVRIHGRAACRLKAS